MFGEFQNLRHVNLEVASPPAAAVDHDDARRGLVRLCRPSYVQVQHVIAALAALDFLLVDHTRRNLRLRLLFLTLGR